jgi:hypothetical protein
MEVKGRRERGRQKLPDDLKEKEDTVDCKLKHKIAICRELVVEEVMSLSLDRIPN